MVIIFDLDYTLLDTKKLKLEMAGILKPEDFAGDYQKYFKDRNINFNLEIYLAILKASGRIDESRQKELKLRLARLIKRLDDYIFPGVEKILKRLKDGGAKLILMTFGDKKWQAAKVANLSLKKYFDRINFEDKDKSKSKLLKSLKNQREEILIVNDNAREAKEMVKIIGKRAKVFLVAGPYAENIGHDWPISRLEKLN